MRRLSFRAARVAALLGVAAGAVFAGEYVVVDTGFRIHAKSHETIGDVIRVHTSTGVIELPASSVFAFEAEEYQAPPQVPAAGKAAPDAAGKPAPAKPADPKQLVREAAERAGLPASLVHSVAAVESGFRSDVVSPKGAIGVMQLMPQTARALAVDPHDTAQNIEAGARLLRELLLKYDGDVVKALSAYNAGSGAVDRYKGMPPYAETQEYVYKVVKTYLKNGGK
ncbi:MAG: lytic transglycosylase domain-containing protein [Bryobacteraceae bacterium]